MPCHDFHAIFHGGSASTSEMLLTVRRRFSAQYRRRRRPVTIFDHPCEWWTCRKLCNFEVRFLRAISETNIWSYSNKPRNSDCPHNEGSLFSDVSLDNPYWLNFLSSDGPIWGGRQVFITLAAHASYNKSAFGWLKDLGCSRQTLK